MQQEVQQAVQDGDKVTALSRVHAFLKPLRERKAARGEVRELVVPAAESGPVTFMCGWQKTRPQNGRGTSATTKD